MQIDVERVFHPIFGNCALPPNTVIKGMLLVQHSPFIETLDGSLLT